MVIDI